MKFKDTPQDLETIVTALGKTITSSVDNGATHQIKTVEGVTITLYSNGTLQFQGKPAIKQQFEEEFSSYNGSKAQTPQPKPAVENSTAPQSCASKDKQVFIVHGHDDTAREQLELVLHKLGLDPFVLANSGGHGSTIIEALESKIGKNSKATSFGIVLMTPDDMGYALNAGADSIKHRARQNVVLEMGMLISSIGRKNMAILVKGSLEKPSDADGILYLSFNNHVKEVVPKLVTHLKNSGFILSPDKISHASS